MNPHDGSVAVQISFSCLKTIFIGNIEVKLLTDLIAKKINSISNKFLIIFYNYQFPKFDISEK